MDMQTETSTNMEELGWKERGGVREGTGEGGEAKQDSQSRPSRDKGLE
jgi:hypothetical protein